MYIIKNGKKFTIEEKGNHWNDFRREGTEGVNLRIDKTICPTIEDVVKCVRESDFLA